MRGDTSAIEGSVFSGRFIPQLTFIRFPAVVLIALFHYGATGFPFSSVPFLRETVVHGYLVVTFFFVLSGFTLVVGYGERRIELTTFMLRRLARIYPLYVLGLLFFIAAHVYYGTIENQLTAVVVDLFLIQAWTPPFALSLNSPCWFLSVLFSFYLVFPMLLDWLKRLKPMQLCLTLTLVWLGSLVVSIWYKRTVYVGYPSAGHNLLFYNPLIHLNSFLIGVGGGLLARIYLQPRRNVRWWSWGLLGVSFIGLVVVVNAVEADYLLHNGLLAPIFLIAILAIALDSSWLARLFSTRTALMLGNMSFAIYILQGPWKVTFLTVLSRLGFRAMSDLWFSYLITLLLLSLIAVVVVEGPLDRLLLRKTSSNRT